MLKTLVRIVGIFLLSGAAALLGIPSAAAHVNAYFDGGTGETGLITLRVPAESDNPHRQSGSSDT